MRCPVELSTASITHIVFVTQNQEPVKINVKMGKVEKLDPIPESWYKEALGPGNEQPFPREHEKASITARYPLAFSMCSKQWRRPPIAAEPTS